METLKIWPRKNINVNAQNMHKSCTFNKIESAYGRIWPVTIRTTGLTCSTPPVVWRRLWWRSQCGCSSSVGQATGSLAGSDQKHKSPAQKTSASHPWTGYRWNDDLHNSTGNIQSRQENRKTYSIVLSSPVVQIKTWNSSKQIYIAQMSLILHTHTNIK